MRGEFITNYYANGMKLHHLFTLPSYCFRPLYQAHIRYYILYSNLLIISILQSLLHS